MKNIGEAIRLEIRGMVISGNSSDLFLKNEAVGDDIRYRRSSSAPTIVKNGTEARGAT